MMIKHRLHKIPNTSGIYLFYNAKKALIYVGKATNLKNRVRSYFSNNKKQITKNKRPIETLITEVLDIKWVVTDSVLEAIILEANYIKKYQPKYNVEGKDDKSWNFVVITDEEFPKVTTVRRHNLVRCFGKKLETRNWKLGDYTYVFGPYPWLNAKAMMSLLRRLFFISTCLPAGKQSKYDSVGRPCFYYQIGECLGVCTGEISPREYKEKVIKPLIIFLRGNKKRLIISLEKKMKEFSKKQEYEEAARLRDQVNVLKRIRDIALLNKSFFEHGLRVTGYGLRIEGFDISNLGSTGKAGSMVVFVNGEPDKSQYRKFKIKTVEGQSDVDCLEEVLRRRIAHAQEIRNTKDTKLRSTKNNYWPLPDLFLIDGGKPQVNRVKKVLLERGIEIPVVGIAKGRERKKNEFVFGERGKEKEERGRFVKWVEENNKLLIQVRDEAHRFVIAYQKKLRRI
ncbi:MAG: GIY-YIG nuclease family protein [Patescibacteria group bacterium]